MDPFDTLPILIHSEAERWLVTATLNGFQEDFQVILVLLKGNALFTVMGQTLVRCTQNTWVKIRKLGHQL